MPLRASGAVHVAGTLTREVVRNLIDASEGWEDWNVDRYTALRISADGIIDPQVPTFSRRAARSAPIYATRAGAKIRRGSLLTEMSVVLDLSHGGVGPHLLYERPVDLPISARRLRQ